MRPDMKTVVPVEQMAGGDEEDTALLKEMLKEAITYLTSHSWCPEIAEKYFGFGVGGIVAVFLFRLSKKIQGTDEFLWVVVGDMPSVYLNIVDEAENPKDALLTYCELMDDWVAAVRNKTPLDKVYPVRAAPTLEHADMLSSRMQSLREDIIPQYGLPWPDPEDGTRND